MEQFTCRTCLNITDKYKCTEISKICCFDKSDKTIKDVIILLVPQMASTLFGNEWVCKNCLRTLKSCMRFVERCLEIEQINAENQKALEQSKIIHDWSKTEGKSIDIDDNVVLLVNEFDQIDLDHNYYIKIEPEDCDDTNNEGIVEDDTNLPENCATSAQLLFDSFMPDNIELTDPDNHCTLPQSMFYDSLSTDKEGKVGYKDKIDLDDCDLVPKSAPSSEDFNLETSQLNNVKNEKLTCRICSEKFSCVVDYELHLEIHPAFICDQCGKRIKTEVSYRRHMRTHTEDGLKLCDFCGRRYVSMTALKMHVSARHKQESPFMCDKCPKRFKNKIKLRLHIRMVHEKAGQQQCQDCGKLFLNRETCLSHYRLVHLKLKPFVCNVCGKEFGRKDYLHSHRYVHSGEPRPKLKNVTTENATKENVPTGTVTKRKRARSTIRLKDPGKPVNCNICGKMISSLHGLKAHLRTHVKLKRHKCKYCKLTFTLAANRDRHEQNHELDPENKFRCDICWKRVKTELELAVHVQGHYKDRPPNHACDICGEKFHRKYLLHNHHLEMHTGPDDIEKAEQEIVMKNLLEYAYFNT